MSKKNDNTDMLVKIDGFNGPFRNQYLKGLVLGAGIKKFKNFNDAIKAAKKHKNCAGITLTRMGNYELRKGLELRDSDPNNRFKSIEITWVLNNDFKEEKKVKKIIKRKKKENVYSVYKSKKPNPETYEIIKVKGVEYYYNVNRRELRDLEGNIKGNFIRGKVIFL